MASEIAVASGIAFLGTVAALLQLLWGQDIGLADNGDGFRLMCHFRLAKSSDVLANPLVLHYQPQPGGCLPHLAYFSSAQWLVRPALWLYHLRHGADAGFDLRYLGVVHSGVFGVLLAALYLALPGSRGARALTTVIGGVLLSDVSFVAYFVSPFSEPATFFGLLAMVAAGTWYVRCRRVPVLALVVLVAATAFLVLAKSQTFVVALIVVPVVLSRPVEAGPLWGAWKGRIVPVVACVTLLATAAGNLLQQPPFFTDVNKHNMVFYTLLVDSPEPESTLRELGVPTGLVRYRGSGYFTPQVAAKDGDVEYREFQRVVDRRSILTYLATHPSHWWPLFRAGARAVAEVRPDYLSNYPIERPEGALLAPRANPAERLLGALAPVSWPLLPLVWVVGLVASAGALLRRSLGVERRALWAACYLLTATASSQWLISIAGDGYYELVKHTVLAGYATALLVAVGCGALAPVVVGRLRNRESWRETDVMAPMGPDEVAQRDDAATASSPP